MSKYKVGDLVQDRDVDRKGIIVAMAPHVNPYHEDMIYDVQWFQQAVQCLPPRTKMIDEWFRPLVEEVPGE